MSFIHSSAVIAPGARIAPDAKVGPFCVVGPDCVLEAGVELVSHAVIDGRTTLHQGVKVMPYGSVGLAPQDLKYDGRLTGVDLGAGRRALASRLRRFRRTERRLVGR